MMIWNSVDDKMPPKRLLVLVHEESGRIVPAQLEREEWGDEIHFYAQLTQCGTHDTYPCIDVTHWMFLPKRPMV